LFKTLIFNYRNGSLRSRLVRAAGGSFLVKIGFQGLNLVISILLARLLGADGYGAYAYAIAVVSLLSVFSLLGFDRLLVRQIAIYKMKAAYPLLRGILRWTSLVAFLVGLAFTILLFFFLPAVAPHFDPRITAALRIAAFMLPFVALAKLRQAAMQGLGHLTTGLLPEMIIQPALFIFLLLIVQTRFQLDVALVMSLQLLACVSVYFFGAVQLRLKTPAQAKSALPAYRWQSWLRSGLPILFIGGVGIINSRVDTLMLGAMTNAASVGIYVVAARGAEVILVALITANAAISPVLAELYESGQKERMQVLVVRSSRVVLLAALPLAAVFVLFGPWLLSFFGPEFVSGSRTLTILSVSQLLHVTIGSAVPLLVMTGHERPAAMAVASGAFLNLFLNWLLIPLWGMEGAALASGTSIVLSTLILSAIVSQRLGIRGHPFHRLRKP
jgi:O-antigen/teichoic acid export membrane protein